MGLVKRLAMRRAPAVAARLVVVLAAGSIIDPCLLLAGVPAQMSNVHRARRPCSNTDATATFCLYSNVDCMLHSSPLSLYNVQYKVSK